MQVQFLSKHSDLIVVLDGGGKKYERTPDGSLIFIENAPAWIVRFERGEYISSDPKEIDGLRNHKQFNQLYFEVLPADQQAIDNERSVELLKERLGVSHLTPQMIDGAIGTAAKGGLTEQAEVTAVSANEPVKMPEAKFNAPELQENPKKSNNGLTCEICGFVAKDRRGLAAHKRFKHR